MESEHSGREEAVELREYLADRDVGCPSCRFNLRGLNGRLCPECGSPLKLGLSTPKRRDLLDWVTMTLVAGLGFGLILSAVVVAQSVTRGGFRIRLDIDDEHALLVMIVAFAYIVGVAVWLPVERRLRARPSRATAVIVMIMAVVSIAVVIAIMTMDFR